MARPSRLDVAGVPHHVVQRGHNRQPCFFTALDYGYYLDSLSLASKSYGCSIHAYVLMPNHVHLLVTTEEVGALSRMMQSLGRRYVRYVNAEYDRSGTLWEGRFRSSLVESARYLLTCYRYVELNPVRAGLVNFPSDYRWSSCRHNAAGEDDPLVTPHSLYLALGERAAARQLAYRRLFDLAIPEVDLEAIRVHTNQCKALGSKLFLTHIERLSGSSTQPTDPCRSARSKRRC